MDENEQSPELHSDASAESDEKLDALAASLDTVEAALTALDGDDLDAAEALVAGETADASAEA